MEESPTRWQVYRARVTTFLILMIFVLLIILLSKTIAEAQGVYGADPKFREQMHKIKYALEYAHITDSDWSILVISKKEWWEGIPAKQRDDRSIVGSCYTLRSKKLTWCNQEWLKWAETPAIIRTLRHEYGHIWCKENNSEECAELYAKSFNGGW